MTPCYDNVITQGEGGAASMMTNGELYVLRELRDSILKDRKALRNLERKERNIEKSRNRGLLSSLYRDELPADYAERLTALRDGIYKKQLRYLQAQAALEEEFSRIPCQRVRAALSFYFVDLIPQRGVSNRLGMKSKAALPREKALMMELKEFRFVAAQIERLSEKRNHPGQLPDFFLPLEELPQIPVEEIWKEELETLINQNLCLISYIETISDPYTRNIFTARFIDGKEAREVAREFGETEDSVVAIVRSYLFRHPKGYLSVKEAAELWGIRETTVNRYCLEGKISGAFRRSGYGSGNISERHSAWMIPADAKKPKTRGNQHPEGFLSALELAERWGMRPRTICEYCEKGKIPGAVKRYGSDYGHFSDYFWSIPADAKKPERKRKADIAGYLTCGELAVLWGLRDYTVCKYCRQGKIPGAVLRDGIWRIPADAKKPDSPRRERRTPKEGDAH